MRLSGSLAVSLLVSLLFIPPIRAQKLALRPARSPVGLSSVTGGLMFWPCALRLARPLAFKPPDSL